jgi:hypothetical protein
MDEEETTFDHVIPRGHGGGSRDDRIWVPDPDRPGKLKPQNFAAHKLCNGQRGSRRN